MNKNSILITLIFFLLMSCGYKPIHLNEKNNFIIEKIEINKVSRLNTFSKNSLNSLSNIDGIKKISLLINSNKIKSVTSKDSRGNSQLLTMLISVDIKIYENDKMKSEKNFVESFSYSNDENKFNLSKYEKNIENNLRDKIIKDINIYLVSF